MKRLIILILALIPIISSCKKGEDYDLHMQIREIAWSSLNEQEKSTVIIDWENAPVTETTYQEKNIFSVSFKTSKDLLLGPIVVYIDKTSLVVIGYALRL